MKKILALFASFAIMAFYSCGGDDNDNNEVPEEPAKFELADINHIITYGQSLGEGSHSSPVLTTSPFADNALMFNHGIKTHYGLNPMYRFFVPHIEQLNEENGETPAAGTAQKFIIDYKPGEAYILSSCCAKGSTTIAQLSKGSEWYNNMLADVTNAKRLADEQGKSYKLLAVTWSQGEYDYGNGIEYYKTKLKQLRADLIADVEVITGEDYSKLPFITYQVSSSYSAGKSYPDIGLALYELGIEAGNGFYMATPIYHMQYFDKWHLVNVSSKLLGAYYGHVLSEILSGNEWEPLRPVSHTVSGDNILLVFNKGGLAFSKPDYLTENIPNHGFSVKNSEGKELIKFVIIVSDNTIKIECVDTPRDVTVTYGFSNTNNRNAGELHDSSSVKMKIGGTTFSMYNWCSIFEYKL
ncbi:sialate O-acetylesterase [Dysgonomonas sp. 511]|uniref:sialate O-acetylesterase n=1 Tax=Dysgonomonas sp. 511 TaxID=2302930 RepID=UPI0013CFF0AC|nr:sialate O-acetylesterase [Dysgonomonas sp. 511]NDV78434.1 hypothetical protein [Dysgonomonas sp. 511]